MDGQDKKFLIIFKFNILFKIYRSLISDIITKKKNLKFRNIDGV